MNFLTESNDNLSKNLKNIVKNIEAMNTSTYDYITAAEEEYKLNGKKLEKNKGIECECGRKIGVGFLKKHLLSKIHQVGVKLKSTILA